MNNLRRVLVLSLVLVSGALLAAEDTEIRGKSAEIDPIWKPEKSLRLAPKVSRSFALDNDVLVPGSRDQDYTYGLNMNFVGEGVEDHLASLHTPLDWLDRQFGVDRQVTVGLESVKIEYGLFGFTPEDISLEQPAEGDRPYASLVYVSSTRELYDPVRETSWQTTLTVGVMGLAVVGEVQDFVHSTIDGEEPRGWDTQISEGGEPTARYNVARQGLLYQDAGDMEIKSTLQGSVGYITETSWSLSMRVGDIRTPWVSFNPELTTYGEKAIPTDQSRVAEHYFWTGISLKARAYNAFLQGQFRDSELSYDSDELNHGLVEAWVGYTVALDNGYSFTYSIRGHTSELKEGVGDRNVVWGGLLITRTII